MPERTARRAAQSVRTKTSRGARAARDTAADRKGRAARATSTSNSGVPITDELAAELASEAERGYDLSRGQRVGRKSLEGGSGHSQRLNFRTTADLYDKAMKRAIREGKTVSQLAREALEKFVG